MADHHATDNLFEDSDDEQVMPSASITSPSDTSEPQNTHASQAPTTSSDTMADTASMSDGKAPSTLDHNEKSAEASVSASGDALFDDDASVDANMSATQSKPRDRFESASLDALFKDTDEEEEEEGEEEIEEEVEGSVAGAVVQDTDIPAFPQQATFVAQGDPVSVHVPSVERITKEAQTAILSLPNVAAIEPKPFDPETFDATEPSFSANRAKVTLNSGTVIRWRKVINDDGTEKVESNARIIRWPDGTIQLQIGAEVFQVSLQRSSAEATDLLVVDGAEGVDVALGPITSKLRFFPSNLATSSTHRSLKAVVSSRVAASVGSTKAAKDFKKAAQEEIERAREAERKAKQKEASSGRGKYGLDRYGAITEYDRMRYAGSDDEGEEEGAFSFRDEESSTRRLMSAKESAAPMRGGRALGATSASEAEEAEEEDEESEESFIESEEDEDEDEDEEGDDEDDEDAEGGDDDRKRRTNPKTLVDDDAKEDTASTKRPRIVSDEEDE